MQLETSGVDSGVPTYLDVQYFMHVSSLMDYLMPNYMLP